MTKYYPRYCWELWENDCKSDKVDFMNSASFDPSNIIGDHLKPAGPSHYRQWAYKHDNVNEEKSPSSSADDFQATNGPDVVPRREEHLVVS